MGKPRVASERSFCTSCRRCGATDTSCMAKALTRTWLSEPQPCSFGGAFSGCATSEARIWYMSGRNARNNPLPFIKWM